MSQPHPSRRDGPRLVVLSGAGVSAESGLATFRGPDGLWEGHRVEEVATPEAFAADPVLVHRFYNLRRAQLDRVESNAGHRVLAELEEHLRVDIVTQNIDDLHERAGSTSVLHLHGELRKVRPVDGGGPPLPWTGDLGVGDTDDRGVPLRPHVVWFGEMVPAIEPAMALASAADAVIVVGTSLRVFPAAGLLQHVPADAPVLVVDPDLRLDAARGPGRIEAIRLPATTGLAEARDRLLRLFPRR